MMIIGHHLHLSDVYYIYIFYRDIYFTRKERNRKIHEYCKKKSQLKDG